MYAYSKALVVIYLVSVVLISGVLPCLPALGKDFHPPSPVSLCPTVAVASRVRRLDQNHVQDVPYCSVSLLEFFALGASTNANISRTGFCVLC